MPLTKTVLFKTMLDSAAIGAIALGNAVAPAQAGGNQQATMMGGGMNQGTMTTATAGGGERTLQPIDINIDGDRIKRLVVEVIGQARSIQVSQE